MKKIFLICLCIIGFLLGMPKESLAAGATLSLSPETGTFNTGCNFSLAVNVDTGGYETDGTDAILTYDTTRFMANKINNGSIYQDYPGNNIDAQNGKITISGLSSVGSAYKGAGTLATINFTVAADAPAGASQIKFDFDPTNKAKTTDSNVVERGTMAETLNQVVDGNYVVGTGSCARGGPTPLSTPSATIYKPPPVITNKPPCTDPPCGAVDNTILLILSGTVLTMFGAVGLLKR